MMCVHCNLATVGSSKYCATHRAEARAAWKARIEDSNAERVEREVRHQEILTEMAHVAVLAYENAEPTPMVVYETHGLTDIPKENGKAWYVSDGVCGFAWIVVQPGNCSFARWLAKNNIGHKAYEGGWAIPSHVLVPNETQSYERKMSAVQAAAQVLRAHGIKCRPVARLD